MSFMSKRELLVQVAPRYREASYKERSVILDEFVASTGYARKYAIRILTAPIVPPIAPICRPREPVYGRRLRVRYESHGLRPIILDQNVWRPFLESWYPY